MSLLMQLGWSLPKLNGKERSRQRISSVTATEGSMYPFQERPAL
jgi:hypothetical protein